MRSLALARDEARLSLGRHKASEEDHDEADGQSDCLTQSLEYVQAATTLALGNTRAFFEAKFGIENDTKNHFVYLVLFVR